MAIDLKSLRKNSGNDKMPIIVIYGVEGVGKSTFGAGTPNPVFLPTEDGLGTINCTTFPLLKSFDDAIEAIGSLYTESHDFKAIVVDSLDWLEPLVWQKVCRDHGVNSIEEIGYGRGYTHALNYWREYLDGLNALRDERKMVIIQIAHSTVKRFDNPETEPYDRYQIKLHEKASALIREHADVVGFCNYHISVRKEDVGFNKKVTRGVSSGKRLIYLTEKPAFQAKNRYAMPEQLPLEWEAIAQHLPQFNETAANPEAA